MSIFQSTLSVRRATVSHRRQDNRRTISIHALREESDMRTIDQKINQLISIHALREESDPILATSYRSTVNFNPRSP